jgi:uncharacterized protein (TIGR02271 family)
MSTSTESYTAVAGQAREATEKSVETFKQGVQRFTDQANVFAKIPAVDVTQPVARYFEYVQKSVDLNRGLLTRWVELLTTMSRSFRDQADRVTDIVKGHTTTAPSVGSGEYLTRSEEQLHVGTEKVQTGRARLRKVVVTEQQTVTIPVSREEVRLVREPIAPGDTVDATIGEAAAEVVLTEERVVVSKETVPVERVRLGTVTITEQQEVTEAVRKEKIEFDDSTSTNSAKKQK